MGGLSTPFPVGLWLDYQICKASGTWVMGGGGGHWWWICMDASIAGAVEAPLLYGSATLIVIPAPLVVAS